MVEPEWGALIRRLEIAEALNAHLEAKQRFEENPLKMYTLAKIEEMEKSGK
ncbi:MAG: hypothetical protein R3C14_50575 [Caldilineaceae bacterium]